MFVITLLFVSLFGCIVGWKWYLYSDSIIQGITATFVAFYVACYALIKMGAFT